MDINRFQNFLQLLDDVCAKLTYNGSGASDKIKSMGLSDGDTSISESQFISWIRRNSNAGYDEAKKLSARIVGSYPSLWFSWCYKSNTDAANQLESVYRRITDLRNELPLLIEKMNSNPDAESNLRNINNMITNDIGSFVGRMFEENVNEAYDIISGYSETDSDEEKSKQLINILGIPSMFLNSGSDIELFMRIKWVLEHTPFFETMNSSKDLLVEHIKTKKISVEFDTPYTIYLPTGVVATYKVSVEGGGGGSVENETIMSVADNQLDTISKKISFSSDSLKAGISSDGNVSMESSYEVDENTSVSTELGYDITSNSLVFSTSVEQGVSDGVTVKTTIEIRKRLDDNWSYEWEPVLVEDYSPVYVDRNVTDDWGWKFEDALNGLATFGVEVVGTAAVVYGVGGILGAGAGAAEGIGGLVEQFIIEAAPALAF